MKWTCTELMAGVHLLMPGGCMGSWSCAHCVVLPAVGMTPVGLPPLEKAWKCRSLVPSTVRAGSPAARAPAGGPLLQPASAAAIRSDRRRKALRAIAAATVGGRISRFLSHRRGPDEPRVARRARTQLFRAVRGIRGLVAGSGADVALVRPHRVLQQHRDGHGADAAGAGRDR